MRKIDKSIILSEKYKRWIDKKETQGEKHGIYTSSNHRFYTDIVMNLLHCQNGLCAYTEVQLCAMEDCSSEMWQDGKFIELEEKVNYGHLEHFDASLKTSKCWLWENLFVVSADANNAKLATDVDYILKPDLESYNPYSLLSYSSITGLYRPNSGLSLDEKERVNKMITILGINHPNLRNKRKEEVRRLTQFPSITPREFPTAIEMTKQLS